MRRLSASGCHRPCMLSLRDDIVAVEAERRADRQECSQKACEEFRITSFNFCSVRYVTSHSAFDVVFITRLIADAFLHHLLWIMSSTMRAIPHFASSLYLPNQIELDDREYIYIPTPNYFRRSPTSSPDLHSMATTPSGRIIGPKQRKIALLGSRSVGK